MKIRADMHFKDAYTCDKEYIVEKAITIRPSEFSYMCKHLLEDNRYLEDNFDSMYYDENGNFHCLLLINDDTGDGLLVNGEGDIYPRYQALIPNAKLLWDMERYPSLKKYSNTLIDVADDIMEKALSNQDDEYFEIDICKYEDSSKTVLPASVLEDMLWDTDLIDDGRMNGDTIEITLKKPEALNQTDKRIINQDELDVMIAKNMLWIHDAGGEPLDLSNCVLRDLNIQGNCLLGADLTNAEFVNCDMQNCEMNDARCINTKFINCNMERAVAEGCDFTNAEFNNCTCKCVAFTASNFTNSKFDSTEVSGAIFMNSCMQCVQICNTDFNKSNMANVSYDEQEWSQDDESPALSM